MKVYFTKFSKKIITSKSITENGKMSFLYIFLCFEARVLIKNTSRYYVVFKMFAKNW